MEEETTKGEQEEGSDLGLSPEEEEEMLSWAVPGTDWGALSGKKEDTHSVKDVVEEGKKYEAGDLTRALRELVQVRKQTRDLIARIGALRAKKRRGEKTGDLADLIEQEKIFIEREKKAEEELHSIEEQLKGVSLTDVPRSDSVLPVDKAGPLGEDAFLREAKIQAKKFLEALSPEELQRERKYLESEPGYLVGREDYGDVEEKLKRIEKDKKVGKKIEITYKNKPNQ